MLFFKKMLHYLGWPFVLLLFYKRTISIKSLARKYYKSPFSVSVEKRYKSVYKLSKNALYIQNTKVVSTGFKKAPTVPALYVVNHKSSIDPLVVLVKMYEANQMPLYKFIAKKELTTGKKFVYAALQLMDTIFIDRNDIRKTFAVYKEQTNVIKDKISIIVFPEGTRHFETDMIGPFQAGAFRIAYNNFIPIVPIVLHGTSGLGSGDNKNYKSKSRTIYAKCLPSLKPTAFHTIPVEQMSNTIREIFIKEYMHINELVSKQDSNIKIFDQNDEDIKTPNEER